MKRIITIGVAAVLGVLLFVGYAQHGEAGNSVGNWISFDQARAKAAGDGKPILVDLYTDWCHWCKVMDKKVYGSAEVAGFLQRNFHIVKINAESDTAVATIEGRKLTGREMTGAFRVRGFPATAFLNETGKLIGVVPGYIPPQKFLLLARYIQGKHYTKMKFSEFEQQKK